MGLNCGGPCMNLCPQTCGNGVLEGTEACDDGNQLAGDGCDSSCASEPPPTVSNSVSVYDAVISTSGGTHPSVEAALAAGAKRIFVRNGAYALSGPLNLGSNVLLEGEDRANTILYGSFPITAGSNVVIRSIALQNDVYPGGIEASGGNNTFDDVNVLSSERFGIVSGDGTMVRNSRVFADAFPLVLGANAVVENNYFEAIDVAEASVGARSKVRGNELVVQMHGDGFRAGTDSLLTNNRIVFNSSPVGNVGIRAHARTVTSDNTLIGCSLDAEESGSVQNNIVIGAQVGIIIDGIRPVGEVRQLRVSGNSAISSLSHGFSLRGENILLEGNTSYRAGGAGFVTSNAVLASIVQGNIADSSSGPGFNFNNIVDSIIGQNIARENIGSGFVLGGVDNIVNANIARISGGFGFEWAALSDSTVTSNRASGNTLGDWGPAPGTGVSANNN